MIWKFDVDLERALWRSDRKVTIKMPACSHVLTAQIQNDKLVLWAIVNPKMPERYVDVCTVLTGEEEPAGFNHRDYVNTVQAPAGLVLHVFCKTRTALEEGKDF